MLAFSVRVYLRYLSFQRQRTCFAQEFYFFYKLYYSIFIAEWCEGLKIDSIFKFICKIMNDVQYVIAFVESLFISLVNMYDNSN
jgi:hypothetical protein